MLDILLGGVMKKRLLLVAMFVIATCAFSVEVPILGGYSTTSAGKKIPGYWLNDKWHELSFPNNYFAGTVSAVFIVGEDLYFAGTLINESKIMLPCYWKNNKLTLLPIASKDIEGKCGVARSIFIRNDNIAVSGYVSLTNGSYRNYAVYWINNELKVLPDLSTPAKASAANNIILGEKIYATGDSTDNRGCSIPSIWTNSEWNKMDVPDYVSRVIISKTIMLDGSIVTAGAFMEKPSEGADPTWGMIQPCYWINTIRFNLPFFINDKRIYTTAIAKYNNKLVFSGVMEMNFADIQKGKPPLNLPTFFNGEEWILLPFLSKNQTNETTDIKIVNGDTIISGYSIDNDGVAYPGFWLNKVWHSLPVLSKKGKGSHNATCIGIVITDI
jgi:hypothetical protein